MRASATVYSVAEMSGWPEGELGPVQVLVLCIDTRGSDEMISAELQDLGNETSIRVIDLLRVRRGADGDMHRLAIADPSGMPGTLVESLLFTASSSREPPDGHPRLDRDARDPQRDAPHAEPRALAITLDVRRLGAARRSARPAHPANPWSVQVGPN